MGSGTEAAAALRLPGPVGPLAEALSPSQSRWQQASAEMAASSVASEAVNQ